MRKTIYKNNINCTNFKKEFKLIKTNGTYKFKLYLINYKLINQRKGILETLCKFKTFSSRNPTNTVIKIVSIYLQKLFMQNEHGNLRMSNICNSEYIYDIQISKQSLDDFLYD